MSIQNARQLPRWSLASSSGWPVSGRNKCYQGKEKVRRYIVVCIYDLSRCLLSLVDYPPSSSEEEDDEEDDDGDDGER